MNYLFTVVCILDSLSCFVVGSVSGTLSKPVLTYDKKPFVGERIRFNCYSRYIGTPSNLSQKIGYKFNYNYRHSMDSFLDITHSEKGKNVSCQASNEIGELSPISNVITLDPYYGPEDITTLPTGSVYNVIEGETVSIVCSAKCYPKCIFVWKYNTDIFRQYRTGSILTIQHVNRSHAGEYRCRADHISDSQRFQRIDRIINVQCRPAKQVAILNGEIFTTLNKKEVVEISVVSDVGPNITWIDETSYTWERTVMDNLKFNYTSFIIAENLSDFGTYGVQICNNNCCIIKFIHLKQMINPDGFRLLDYIVPITGIAAGLFILILVTILLCNRKRHVSHRTIKVAPNVEYKRKPRCHSFEADEPLYENKNTLKVNDHSVEEQTSYENYEHLMADKNYHNEGEYANLRQT
ncbi:Hypothetical predicted protein [Mytilus galloprovincialis]|uniref:Ig-like domain-containing protein n=1 Tax=Mytilus galloprovincialis TaxID=29158 RepID=A0A8B6EC81_MYTGA|nr:Hypothetical predicted protein [Mytilus galloprovincialis]